MIEQPSSLEALVEQLAAQVEALTAKVDKLSARVDGCGVGSAMDGTPPRGDELPNASEELLSWVGKSSFLQRLSTLCFLLVVALILRTVTDNGMINLQLGAIIGMGYAVTLMFMGWRRYRRSNPLAPIFTVCGTVLMFTIVVEAHTHFEALPSVPAYILLMLTGFGAAVISYVHRVPAPVAVGNLGMCLAGAAIDYPSPFFPHLGIVLLTANLLGYFAARAYRYSWLRWILLLVTLFMIHLWGIKLGMTLLGGDKPAGTLAPAWFIPLLTIFTITYLVTGFYGIVRSLPGRIHKFELALPAINVAWAFVLARYVVTALGGSNILLGLIGVIVGAGHLTASTRLARLDPKGARGTNAFVFAGVVLLALALPAAMDGILLSLPLLAAVALWIVRMSEKWRSGSVRLTAYLLQIYASVALAVALLGQETPSSFLTSTVSAGGLACLGLLQYKWCRSHKPPEESSFFSRIDGEDYSAVLVLLAALMSAFFMLRVIDYQVLAMSLAPADLNNAFRCSQSAIINISAAVLMFFALAHRNREVRNVAVLVTVIGAIKVFLYDLIGAHGMPLVISVLSFGLATAVESVILGRWQHLLPAPQEQAPGATRAE
ncbi:MAG: DUF2339 domain-containing protein [Deltaproteobacteria bacterium]|nr:DUF2339 domain-containing protein [Deltaproteobacteria bacterium]